MNIIEKHRTALTIAAENCHMGFLENSCHRLIELGWSVNFHPCDVEKNIRCTMFHSEFNGVLAGNGLTMALAVADAIDKKFS